MSGITYKNISLRKNFSRFCDKKKLNWSVEDEIETPWWPSETFEFLMMMWISIEKQFKYETCSNKRKMSKEKN